MSVGLTYDWIWKSERLLFLKKITTKSLASAVGQVALDTRLGALDAEGPSHETERMVRAAHDIYQSTYYLDVRPSLWKFVPTPAYLRLTRSLDFFTE